MNHHNNYADAVVLSFVFDGSQQERVNQWEHNIAKLGRIFSHQSKQPTYIAMVFDHAKRLYKVCFIVWKEASQLKCPLLK